MDEYKKMYLIMIDAAEKAIEAMERQDYGQAKELLIKGEQDAEEKFISRGISLGRCFYFMEKRYSNFE